MTEEWIRWIPINNLAKKYFIDDILRNENYLELILTNNENENEKIRVLFPRSIYAYEDTDESFRLQTIHKLGEKYTSSFYGKWTFFKVTNSQYVQWLIEESCQQLDAKKLIHFSIIADNVITDIIADYEPIIEHVLSSKPL